MPGGVRRSVPGVVQFGAFSLQSGRASRIPLHGIQATNFTGQAVCCPILLTIRGLVSNVLDMARSFHPPFPSITKQLAALGERLRDARLRRQLTGVLFAERLGVSRDTLNRLEKGDPNIAIGTYMKALRILGLDPDIDLIAKDDVMGRKLQDRALPQRRSSTASEGDAPVVVEAESPRKLNQKALSSLLKGRRKGAADGQD